MCGAIYIGNTQQTLKKIMDWHFSDLIRLLKNRNKSYSFAAHFEQNFNTTTSHTYIRKYMTFKVVKHPNLIGAMKTFTKPNWNLCMEEHLTILKNLHEKLITIMNKNLDIYGAWQHKMAFHQFFLIADDPILTGERVRPLKGFQILVLESFNGIFKY